MENFIKVTAELCNEQGKVGIGPQTSPVEMLLNPDLIAAIQNKKVLLKGANILHAGDKYFTNILLAEKREARSFR